MEMIIEGKQVGKYTIFWLYYFINPPGEICVDKQPLLGDT